MPFGGALVDTARVVRNRPLPSRVDGRTAFTKVTTAWFRCRLTVGARPRTKQGNVSRSESKPKLLYGTLDSEGNTIHLTSEDAVEVVAKEISEAAGLFLVDGEPEPIRKRRSLYGYEATLKRVEPHEFKPRPGVR